VRRGRHASLDGCRRVLAAFGAVDILVCAGITKRVPTFHDDEDWQRIIDTNLTGTLRACRTFGAPVEAGAAASLRSRPRVLVSCSKWPPQRAKPVWPGPDGAGGGVGAAWRHSQRDRRLFTDMNRELLDSPRGREFRPHADATVRPTDELSGPPCSCRRRRASCWSCAGGGWQVPRSGVNQ
jgi:NAD(P)-dependent dehydrogenase (short-subunit alcohol dehydrogenase family)